MKNTNQWRWVAGALLLAAAPLVQAQSTGSLLVRGGFTQISPDVSSGNLTAPSFANTKVDVLSDTQLSGGITYMLTDHWAVDVPLALPFKHDTVGAGAIAGVGKIGVTQFVAEWLSLPLFAGLPDWARFDAERRTNSAAGLAASLRHAGTGSMEPLWDRLGELAVPVLCLTGSLDVRFGEVAARIVERNGRHARHEVMD